MKNTTEPKAKTAREYDKIHDECLIRAVHIYGKKRAAEEIDEFLSKRSLQKFSLLNRHARLTLRSNLQMSIEKAWPQLKGNKIAVSLFTFVHKDWVTDEKTYKVNVTAIKTKVRNALRGKHFIATIEFAVYANKLKKIKGRLVKTVSVHVHAIVWDTSKRQLERTRTRINGQFDAPFSARDNAVRCDKLVGLNDFIDSVGYMSKTDLSTYRLTDEADARQVPAVTTLASRYNRYEKLKDEQLFHFWFAGHQGAPILRAAVQACRSNTPLQRAQIESFLKDYEPGERLRRAARIARNKRNAIRQRRHRGH